MTTSEAQLIGRGARYFPFVLPDQTDRFRRKFDGDIDHELRVLEELPLPQHPRSPLYL